MKHPGWESIDVDLDATAKVQADDFMATHNEKEKRILEVRMKVRTLKEIAEALGYQNYSSVLKRIRKIGQAYEKYAGVEYGFSENKIVAKMK